MDSSSRLQCPAVLLQEPPSSAPWVVCSTTISTPTPRLTPKSADIAGPPSCTQSLPATDRCLACMVQVVLILDQREQFGHGSSGARNLDHSLGLLRTMGSSVDVRPWLGLGLVLLCCLRGRDDVPRCGNRAGMCCMLHASWHGTYLCAGCTAELCP